MHEGLNTLNKLIQGISVAITAVTTGMVVIVLGVVARARARAATLAATVANETFELGFGHPKRAKHLRGRSDNAVLDRMRKATQEEHAKPDQRGHKVGPRGTKGGGNIGQERQDCGAKSSKGGGD